MTKSKKMLIAGAAIAGMLSGTYAMAAQTGGGDKAPKAESGKKATKVKKEKHACKGQNSCKGKGGCGTTKAKNDCKGKGECRTDGKPMAKS